MNRYAAGFTVVELLFVFVIIFFLSSVAYLTFRDGGEIARDTQRKADLRELQTAIEMYKQDNGQYPAGCNAAINSNSWPTGGKWSGQIGTDHECLSGSSEYIIGLAPQYIPTLPTDPRLNGADSGYAYVVNVEGTAYKLMVRNTVESETVGHDHPLKSCPITADNSSLFDVPCDTTDIPAVGGRCYASMCDRVYDNGPNPPSWCQTTNVQFRTSYGVWGGYAYNRNLSPDHSNYARNVEQRTERVFCDFK